jgi:hypothetical protein
LIRLADISIATALALASGDITAKNVCSIISEPITREVSSLVWTTVDCGCPAAGEGSASMISLDDRAHRQDHLQYSLDQLDRAASYLATVLRLSPLCPDGWSLLARLRAARGVHDGAAVAALTALDCIGTRPVLPLDMLPLRVPLWS